MSVKDELLFDFSVSMPRVLVSGNITMIDYVQRVVFHSNSKMIFDTGKRYTVIEGEMLEIKEIKDGRVLIKGEAGQIRFSESLC